MKFNPTTRHKKRVIKLENVITSAYVIITLFKYFITSNTNILTLLSDLTIDTVLAILLYQLVLNVRKEVK